MTESIIAYLSAAVSVAALTVSIANAALSKRRLVAETITANRIQWIQAVRELMGEFIEQFLKNQTDKRRLRLLNAKIGLYIRYEEPIYQALEKLLLRCVQESYSEELEQELIRECQRVLHDAWKRMKSESGIGKWSERRIYERIGAERGLPPPKKR